jgi:hypothetical protein
LRQSNMLSHVCDYTSFNPFTLLTRASHHKVRYNSRAMHKLKPWQYHIKAM